ncbi:MAG: hypothetical protein ACXWZB_05540 [Gaiellaceae bacterium]
MRTTIRIFLLGLVGAFALSGAGTALAAYTSPSLRVTDDRSAVTIRYNVSASDDPTAKLTFYAPTGYTASLSQPAGTTIGTVTAQGTAADLGGALLPLTGTVQVRAANGTYLSGSTQVPIATAAQQCTGTPTHTAYWVLNLQAAGQTLELPVFVDSPAAGAGTSAFASSSIQACLPPPDVPTGTPGRATFGFKLTQVDFKVNRIFTSAGTGQPRWRVLATPYNPGRGTPNAAGSVEAQSVISFPRTLSLRRPTLKIAKGVATVTVSGVAVLPAGVASTIRLYRGKTAAGVSPSITLAKRGSSYRGTLKIRQTTKRQIVFLQTRATVSAGTTTCTPTFGVTCLSATRAAVLLRTSALRVVIPARKK